MRAEKICTVSKIDHWNLPTQSSVFCPYVIIALHPQIGFKGATGELQGLRNSLDRRGLVPYITAWSRAQYLPHKQPTLHCGVNEQQMFTLLNHWDRGLADKYTLWIPNNDYVLNQKSQRKKFGDFKILFSSRGSSWRYPITRGKRKWSRKWRRARWGEAHQRAILPSVVCAVNYSSSFSAFAKKDLLKSWPKDVYLTKVTPNRTLDSWESSSYF